MSSVLTSIYSNVWAFSSEHVSQYIPLVEALVSGRSVDSLLPSMVTPETSVRIYNGTVLSQDSSNSSSNTVVDRKNVAVLRIRGPLMKDDMFCGPLGMESMNTILKSLLAREDIGGVLLDCDSPGGQASYTPIFGATIANANKPIVSYFNSLNASACYWLTSGSKEIYASTKTDIVGSIGTYISLADFTKFYESAGIRVEDIYDDQSGLKNGWYRSWLKGDAGQVKSELLKPITDAFKDHVQSNRTISDSNAFQGKTYMAEEAIEIGMIDGIKSFDDCLLRVYELMEETPSSHSPSQSKSINMAKKGFKTVADLLGYENLESHEGHISLSEEDVSKIEAALGKKTVDSKEEEEEDSGASSNELNDAVSSLATSVTQVQGVLSQMNSSMNSIKSRLDVVEGKTTKEPSATRSPKNEGDPKTLLPWEDPNNSLNKAAAEAMGE